MSLQMKYLLKNDPYLEHKLLWTMAKVNHIPSLSALPFHHLLFTDKIGSIYNIEWPLRRKKDVMFLRS